MARLVTLQQWATSVFGEYAPCGATLYSWAKNGFIQPSPQKAGRRWFVEPDALYVGQQVQPEIPTTSNPVLKRIFANGPSA